MIEHRLYSVNNRHRRWDSHIVCESIFLIRNAAVCQSIIINFIGIQLTRYLPNNSVSKLTLVNWPYPPGQLISAFHGSFGINTYMLRSPWRQSCEFRKTQKNRFGKWNIRENNWLVKMNVRCAQKVADHHHCRIYLNHHFSTQNSRRRRTGWKK